MLRHDSVENFGYVSRGLVYVRKRASAADAKDQAGSTNDGFSWGRFIFLGDPALSVRIHAALP
jgi:hypothetical protein